MNIQPIVEGYGEVEAVPVLLRRLVVAANAYPLGVNPPIRRPRTDLVSEDGVRRAVRLARKQPDCAAILIMVDSDDDCPKTFAPRIQRSSAFKRRPGKTFWLGRSRFFADWPSRRPTDYAPARRDSTRSAPAPARGR